MDKIDYEKKYFELYRKIAELLVENMKRDEPYTPEMLLIKWDVLRGTE